MEILTTARANFHRAVEESRSASLPDAGGRWATYCANARMMIERFASPEEAIYHAQVRAGFETRHTGPDLDGHVWSMEIAIARDFPQFADKLHSFSESPLSARETLTTRDGWLTSSPLCYHAYKIMSILSHLQPSSVVEIGGGTGGPARAWLTNDLHRPRFYVNIDFPESLFYAEVFLRAAAPELITGYLHAGTPFPEDCHVVLCPIANMDEVCRQPIDLLINSGSMQEMSDDYIAFYMDKIERSRWDHFYSINYFGQSITDRRESMNLASPVLSKNWRTTFHTLTPAAHSGTLEALFERQQAPNEQLTLDAARRALLMRPIDTLEKWFTAFDAVRQTDPSALWMDVAAAAAIDMPYVPKETLYLARRAANRPIDQFFLKSLEDLAHAADYVRSQEEVGGTADETLVTVNGIAYEIVPEQLGGYLEYVMDCGDRVDLAGWAGDTLRDAPAECVVAAVNGRIVRRASFLGERADVEAGWGAGLKPCQFSIEVGIAGETPTVRLFALTSAFKALPIKPEQHASTVCEIV